MLTTVISIFIGNFLIGLLFKPALDHLRSVRDELVGVQFPIRDHVADVVARINDETQLDANEMRRKQYEAKQTINKILVKYRLAYLSFQKVGSIFFLLLLALVNLTVASAELKFPRSLGIYLGANALVILVAIYLSSDSYPSPNKLASIEYLVNHYDNMFPDLLIDVIEPRIQIVNETGSRQRFMLATSVHLTGYKFFVAVTNSDQTECYLVFLGKIGESTDATHFMHPKSYFWHIKLDELNISRRETIVDRVVFVHLFVFLPSPASWRNEAICPFFSSSPLWERHPAGEQWGDHMGATSCRSGSTDSSIQFRRTKGVMSEKWEITSIRTDQKNENYRLRRLIQFYKRELENSSNIRAFHRWNSPRIPE
jgi:hypothetical protein